MVQIRLIGNPLSYSKASISAAKKTEGHMVDLKGEVSELQSTIREEQQYSNR